MAHIGLKHALESVRPLLPLLEDKSINEILVNPGLIWVEHANGRPGPCDLILEDHQIEGIIANLANISHREVDLNGGRGHHLISAKLPPLSPNAKRGTGGFRLEAQLPPVAIDGPYLTIRRIPEVALSLADYVNAGTMPEEIAAYLAEAVAARKNILVSGGTSSGKTSFLNALIRVVDHNEVLYFIETVAELVVTQPFARRLEADEEHGYTVARLLKSTLRSRPDRIFIGEVRGGEAYDLADSAANSGHQGSMASIHANSSLEALDRFENLILEGRPAMPLQAVKSRISKTFDLIVHMERRLLDGRYVRRVAEITELTGLSGHAYLTKTIFPKEK